MSSFDESPLFPHQGPNYALVELYAQQGLTTLNGLTSSIADHLRLLASNPDHLRSASLDCDLLMRMLALAVELIHSLLGELLLPTLEAGSFRDQTPVKALCRAYAAASAFSEPLRVENGLPLDLLEDASTVSQCYRLSISVSPFFYTNLFRAD